MHLPVMPPVAPMLARAVRTVPDPAPGGGELLYEPKWDGFRCIAFRDGDEVELGSRGERPLTRYFPEVVAGLLREVPARCVLDGELVVPIAGRLEFDALSQRIHPAASRVRLLAESTPAAYVVFDVLAVDDDDLRGAPLRQRREVLERVLAAAGPVCLPTPATRDPEVARHWFTQFEGAGLDGVVAKPLDGGYRPGERAMLKVKHERTADCVVAGYRLHKDGAGVGSLLLGLYDDAGALHHVGVAASFPAARRRELLTELAPHRLAPGEEHPWAAWGGGAGGAAETRMPGAPSRWSGGKDLSFEMLRPELVAEVGYDHLQGTRFRHTTQLRRWRPDRDPSTCTYAQLDRPAHFDLAAVLHRAG